VRAGEKRVERRRDGDRGREETLKSVLKEDQETRKRRQWKVKKKRERLHQDRQTGGKERERGGLQQRS